MGFRPVAFKKRDDLRIKFAVPVENDVAVWAGLRKGLAQLLNDPFCSRISSHVEVKDLAASLCDDEEAVQQLEGRRRHAEEVEGHDGLTVIVEKGKPLLAWITLARHAL